MVKKVVTNLNSSKDSGSDYILVAALKNCEAELVTLCLRESCFADCWKVSLVVPVFKNVVEGSTVKNYHTVSLPSMVSKVFEKLVNNRLVDHLEKCDLFSNFQYVVRFLY